VKSIWSTFQLMLTATGGYIGYFLGGWDGFLYALVAFVVIDYVTGLMVAILNKKLSSEIGARGIEREALALAPQHKCNPLDLLGSKSGPGYILSQGLIR
jgi:phage-related holin